MVSFSLKVIGFGLLIMAMATLHASAQVQCSTNNKCPDSAPCCSEFGYCGAGRFCLGGCNPLLSFNANSCAPSPICQSMVYNLNDPNKFVDSANYNGGTSYDIITDGQPIVTNGDLLLTLAKNTHGTRISTTRYIWYGRVTAKMKTARTQGIVTSFITMSNIKDEIDWEWVGYNLQISQSNYFYRGNLDYQNSAKHPVDGGDTFQAYHEYTIDWQQDQLQWFVDGKLVRTLTKKETFNATDGTFAYPSTPARIQIGIWNAGEGPKGTRDWAGGATDWDSDDIKSPGYFYARVASLQVQCVNTTAGATSYTYNNNGTVVLSNANTTVKVVTPQSQGLPQEAGDNVNSMPNITGQYIPNLKTSNSNRFAILASTFCLGLFIIPLFGIIWSY